MASFVARTHLTAALCRMNQARIRSMLGTTNPAVEVERLASQMPLTHTLPHSRASSVFRDIGNELAGLYSRRWRIRIRETKEGNGPAHETGLFEYVFAFHGIHDAHYAREYERLLIVYPIGLFISRVFEKQLESRVEEVNATYRDLAVGGVVQPPYADWFLSSPGAREIVALEVITHYQGLFWSYWGDPDNQRFRIDTHWKRLIEFHFFQHVPARAIVGIVWPELRLRGLGGAPDKKRPVALEIFSEIRRRLPHTRMHLYEIPPYQEKDAVKRAFAVASRSAADSYTEADGTSSAMLTQ